MSRTMEVGSHKTAIHTNENGMTNVVYHSTAVVSFNYEKIVLNSGGCRTVTTKTRMNQASNQFGLGFSVFQKDYEWYVKTKEGTVFEFYDGMEIKHT